MTAVKETVAGIVASGQLSIFTGGYWKHPGYKLPAEANLMAVAHYLDALEFQRSMIRINTVFGGKNPHPNFLVGGMACTIDPHRSESVNQVQIDQIAKWIAESVEFVKTCYVPDAMAIVGAYKEYFDIGASSPNYLAVGLNGATYAGDPAEFKAAPTPVNAAVMPGVLWGDDFTTVHPLEPSKIEEWVSSAWYKYGGGDVGLTPDVGETSVAYTGPNPPYEWLADKPEYTWSKAPRYEGKPMQVGPLARVLLAYARGHGRTVEIVDGASASLGIELRQLNSTAGRTLARAVECLTSVEVLAEETFPAFVANLRQGDIDVFDKTTWEPATWPKSCAGFSMLEVARGMLSHWVTIENRKIERYQAVVPSTWNGGGRDAQGVKGPYEEALAGDGKHPLVNAEEPLEVLRTIHSFDPCMSCAVHVLDASGSELAVVVTA